MRDAHEIRRAIDELDAGFALASAVPDDDPAWPDVEVTPQQRVASLAGLLSGLRRTYEVEVRPAALAHAAMLESTDFDAVGRSFLDLDAAISRLGDVTSHELDPRNPVIDQPRLDTMTIDPAQLDETQWRALVTELAFDLRFLWAWGRP